MIHGPALLESAVLVAPGDSQTYGTGVGADQAWPRILESIGGLPVYNMGVGGYGPTHSLLLLDEARTFQPSVVVEAFYFDNLPGH